MAWLGWLSSLVLLATIVYQVRVNVEAPDNGGVSRWLYFGQLTASLGFLGYSWSVDNMVFVVTNSLLVVAALVGAVVHARKERGES